MNLKKILISFVIVLMTFSANAQIVGATELHQWKYASGDFCVKVYLHRVTHPSFPALTDLEVKSQIRSLNKYFKANGNSGIEFVDSGTIQDHTYDALGGNSIVTSNGQCDGIGNFTKISPHSHNDGVDVYLFNVNLPYGSAANKIAYKTEMVISNSHLNNQGLAHEMGHVLGLFHTKHGTIGNGNNYNCENFDGYNNHKSECGGDSRSSGDYVSDTVADAGVYYWSTLQDCKVGHEQPTPNSCSGQPFPLQDLKNIMRSSPPQHYENCAAYFTPGQIGRMKWFITRLGVDTSCSVDPLPTCNDCISPGQNIINSLKRVSNSDCRTFKVNIPYINSCFKIEISWGDGTISTLYNSNSNTQLTHNYSNTGIYRVMAVVYDLEGTRGKCSFAKDFIQIPTNCSKMSCTQCLLDVNYTYTQYGPYGGTNSTYYYFQFYPINYGNVCDNSSYTYEWRINNNLVSTEAQPFEKVYASTGSPFNMKLTMKNITQGCQDEISKNIYILQSASSNYNTLLYQTPEILASLSEIYIKNLEQKEISELQIMDILGRSKKFNLEVNNVINVEHLDSGIYFLRILTIEGKTHIKKFIVSKY